MTNEPWEAGKREGNRGTAEEETSFEEKSERGTRVCDCVGSSCSRKFQWPT